MLNQLGRLACCIVLFMGSSLVFAQDSVSEGSDEEYERRGDSKFYVCTATATDDSGLFFMGMSHNMADAYIKAMNACTRQKRICTVSCEAQL